MWTHQEFLLSAFPSLCHCQELGLTKLGRKWSLWRQGKKIFSVLCAEGGCALDVRDRLGLQQLQDVGMMNAVFLEVLEEYCAVLQRYRGGETKLFGFLMGQARDKTKGQGGMKQINALLRKALRL